MSTPQRNPPEGIDILLVEDNPYDAELTLRALRQVNLGDRVTWLRDGAETLEFLFGASGVASLPGSAPPKLVLLDLKLPKVEGQEVLRRIKGDPRTRMIPVVILTSSREDGDVRGSYEAGANGYVVKPVDFVRFTATIKQLGQFWLQVNEPPPDRLTPGEHPRSACEAGSAENLGGNHAAGAVAKLSRDS